MAGENDAELASLEFNQMFLIFSNVLWLVLEYTYLNCNSGVMFSIIRLSYFFVFATVRTEGRFDKDIGEEVEVDEQRRFNEVIRAIKVYICDVFSWCLLIWIFGRSIL